MTTATITHDPIVTHYPGTLEQPEEISVLCSCGGFAYESMAGAGGGCDTHWAPHFEEHVEDTEVEG